MVIDLSKKIKFSPKDSTFKTLKEGFINHLDEFDEYFFIVEESLENKEKELVNRIKSESEKNEEYDLSFFEDFYIDDWNQIGAIFPSIFRKSLLLSIYSLFEFELINVCRKIETVLNNDEKFKIKKKKGNVESAKLYLKKSCILKSNDFDNIWETITVYRHIRNNIVHRGGRLYDESPNYKVISQFIEKHTSENFIEVTNSGYMFFSKKFIEFFIQSLKLLFEIIYCNIESNHIFKRNC